MEINEKNKKFFDDSVEDYRNTYKDKMTPEQLETNAKKFALGQLIFEGAKNKEYTLAYGKVAPEDIKQYDVVLSVSMFTDDIRGFYAILSADREGDSYYACRVKRGDGDIDTDKIVSIELYRD